MGLFDRLLGHADAPITDETAGYERRWLGGFSLFSRPFEVKKAFDALRVGITGRAQYPECNLPALLAAHRRSELVYACIEKICQAAIDPEPIVERKRGDEWQIVPGHPLRRLLMRPNPMDDAASFLGAWLASEHIAGVFYAEIVRENGVPVQLWPLDPSKVYPVAGQGRDGSPVIAYEWRDAGQRIRLKPEDVFVRRNKDLTSKFFGLAPLEVAMGSVDLDRAFTDHVRAFFNNGGVPSGILKYTNRNLTPAEAEQKRQLWSLRYGRGGMAEKGIAILDQTAEYQKIGESPKELEADSLTGRAESRVCMVFGVPPILVGAYVGLLYVNQRASAREAQTDFWINKMSPTFKGLRSFLTWVLLPEFEPLEHVLNEQVRVSWDMSNVVALQEDKDKHHERARKDFQAGGLTLNEYRTKINEKPDPDGDYYLQPTVVTPITSDVAMQQAQTVARIAQGKQPPVLSDGGAKVFDMLEAQARKLLAPAPLVVKTFIYEGLALAREPTEAEVASDLKSISQAQLSARERLKVALLDVRRKLVQEAVADLAERDPADLHQLILAPPPKAQKTVRKVLGDAYRQGRMLVANQAVVKRAANALEFKAGDDADELDTIADTTLARLINDVQAKGSAILATLSVLGVMQSERRARIEAEMSALSDAPVEQFAAGAANRAVELGREAEMEARADEIDRYIYSAILDVNTCVTCGDADGQEAGAVEDLPPAPNGECEGGDRCRCFIVAVFTSEG